MLNKILRLFPQNTLFKDQTRGFAIMRMGAIIGINTVKNTVCEFISYATAQEVQEDIIACG